MTRMTPQSTIRTSRERSAGFTLIELVIVSVLIVSLTAAIMPVFRGTFISLRRERAIRDLMATMKYAQSRAIVEGSEFRIYFHPPKNAYWLARQILTEEGYLVFKPVMEATGGYTKLPDKLLLQTPDARREGRTEFYYISFFPSGACNIATIKIALAEAPHKRYVISTEGRLGHFSLKEP